MTTSQAVYAALSGDATVAGLVATRIYPLRSPQGCAPPYIIFQQIGSDPDASHAGASGATHRMFQLACFATTYESVQTLRDAARDALDGVELGNGDTPTLEDERDGEFDDAIELHRADCDFLI